MAKTTKTIRVNLEYKLMHGAHNYFAVFDRSMLTTALGFVQNDVNLIKMHYLNDPNRFDMPDTFRKSVEFESKILAAKRNIDSTIEDDVANFQKNMGAIRKENPKNLDGVLLIYPSYEASARMVILNSDGSRPQMCGNGIRCVAHSMLADMAMGSSKYTIQTDGGVKEVQVAYDRKGKKTKMSALSTVDMGKPDYLGRRMFMIEGKTEGIGYNVRFQSFFVRMPNEHAVIITDKKLSDEWFNELPSLYGSKIENHIEFFPKKTNVHFVRPAGKNRFDIRTWERGVADPMTGKTGETFACGTGACATVAVLYNQGYIRMNSDICMQFKKDALNIKYSRGSRHMIMTGPSEIYGLGQLALDMRLR